jgi:cobalamin biosynthetic protein CobC
VTESPLEAAWSEFSYHGGNLGAARRLFPGAPAPWIDLPTGVNPHPCPLPPLASEHWARLSEPERFVALEVVAAIKGIRKSRHLR